MAKRVMFDFAYPAGPQPKATVRLTMTPGKWAMIEFDEVTGSEMIAKLRSLFLAIGIELAPNVDWGDFQYSPVRSWHK